MKFHLTIKYLFIFTIVLFVAACQNDNDITSAETEINKILKNKTKEEKEEALKELIGPMIPVPAGEYYMGSNKGSSYEEPVHRVSVKAFRIAQFQVTQKQWQNVMNTNPSYFKGCDECPVEKVSWNEVQQFIARLNKISGQGLRLPSEAEWEYACRSTGNSERYCGGNIAKSFAWYFDNSSRKTHPVSEKRANSLGIYDMSGNVWEWVQDCWNPTYKDAPADSKAWLTGQCKSRVLRGGSWDNKDYEMRLSYRNWDNVDKQDFTYGFRLARD